MLFLISDKILNSKIYLNIIIYLGKKFKIYNIIMKPEIESLPVWFSVLGSLF